MPRNAVATGGVSLVLPVAQIPGALFAYHRRLTGIRTQSGSNADDAAQSWLPSVIEVLRTRTPHDFTHYKPGTLQRRIERRLAMAEVATDSMARYLEILQTDAGELDLPVQDLHITITKSERRSVEKAGTRTYKTLCASAT